jgi:predicted nucleic acid-binding protein
MRVFFDTSVLIAAVLEQHRDHARAFPALERVQQGTDTGFIAAHSLAEMYAMLTKAPAPFRHAPEHALLSIEENILDYFNLADVSAGDYPALLREAALSGVQGGTIYDALLLKCASKVKVDQIFTFNLRHFQAVASRELAAIISAP